MVWINVSDDDRPNLNLNAKDSGSMADGGQRLLDVIDDPNALETFLGSLSSDDLLHSGSVNNVVEQLTGSLGNEYDIDSPSDTLFDTLESSGNLTDISQSTVPFDFGPTDHHHHQHHHGLDHYAINPASMDMVAGNIVSSSIAAASSTSGQFNLNNCTVTSEQQQQMHHHHHQLQNFTLSSSNNTCDSSASSTTTSFSNLLSSSSNLNINNTLSNTSNSNFSTTNLVSDSSSSNNNILYSTSSSTSSTVGLQQQQQTTISAAVNGQGQIHIGQLHQQHEQIQLSSLSSTSMVQSQSHSTSSTPLSGMISINSSGSGGSNMNQNQNQSQVTLNGMLSFHEQNQLGIVQKESTIMTDGNKITTSVEMPSLSTTTQPQTVQLGQLQFTSTADSTTGTVTISATTSSAPQQQQQHQHQAITAAQFANLSLTQLVQQAQQQAQAAVLGPQIISTGGGLQLQTTHQQPSFFIDANGQLVAAASGGTGTSSFSTSNLALVATAGGVQPYAVLAQPSAQQLFSTNTITMQPQTTTIQSIKNPNGSTTYFQTSTPQIIGTNTIQQQTSTSSPQVGGSGAGNSLQSSMIRPKPPPQLLPKPSATSTKGTPTASVSKPGTPNSGGTTPTSTDAGFSTSVNSNGLNTIVTANNVIGSTNTSTVTSLATPMTTNSISLDTLGQFLQQHGQQTISTSGLTFTQPSFAIGPNGMVVSGVNNLNAMTASPQAILLNQMGQQMIVPTAQGGIQILLRQQPSQPQLVIPTLGTQAGANNKPIIRYVAQNSLQMQQPQFIIRTMPTQIQTPTQTQSQPTQPTSATPPAPTPPPQVVVTQTPEPRKSAPVITPPVSKTPKQIRLPTPTPPLRPPPVNNAKSQPSPEPPKKKAKQTKKKVTIDLNDLFKKAGIESGDFEDDGFDFFGPSESTTPSQNGIQTPDTTKLNGTAANNNNSISTPSFHSLPHVRVLEPVDKTKQRKTPKPKPKGKGKAQQQLTPPPPVTSAPSITLPAPPKPVIGKDGKVIFLAPPIVPNLDVPVNEAEFVSSSRPKKPKTKNKKVGEPEPPPPPPPPIIPSPPPAKKKKYPTKKTESSTTTGTPNHTLNNLNLKPLGPPPAIPLISTPAPRPIVTTAAAPVVPVPVATTNSPSVVSQPFNATPPRVHTVSLSPQNQQLLRNIQIQINRLVAITSRNETEETALQKLRVLQQQVIATGITVPNPPQVQTLSTTQGIVVTAANGISVLSPINTCISSAIATISNSVTNSPSSTTFTVNNISAPDTPTTATELAQHLLLNNNSSCSRSGGIILSSSQPPPLILKPVVTNAGNNNGQTVSQQVAASENNTNIVAVTTDPTTKRAFIISVASKGGLANSSASVGAVVDSAAPASSTNNADKVTSATGTTTTTTISTTNGGIRQYPQYQYQTQQQQQPPPPVLIRSLIDDKKAEEQRLAKLKQEEEARNKRKKEIFEKRYQKDQDNFLNPDYKTPFKSMKDAVERLSSFHIARERREMEFEEFDHDFSETACHLIDKFHGMVAKYRALVLRESMREVACCEHVMLERIFVGEERASLEQDRSLVADGQILELPPPPSSWVPQIEEYVETELKEMERDSVVNQQVQSAIDSIMTFGNNDSSNYMLPEESDKIEVDAFGVPISSSGYSGVMNSSSSADIDEAVRSILI